MTDARTPEIVVQQTARIAVAMNLLRQGGILLGGIATVAAIVGRRDMRELATFMTSEAAYPVVAAAVFIGSSAWSLWKTIHNERVKRALARSAPIGAVKGETP